MDALVAWMRERGGLDFEARAYVDTGPVQERVYAQYAGLGWIGKNTCVINPEIGSWLFLSEIICSLPLEPDAPALDQCGSCRLCLDSCPTGAIVDPYVVDATRCLSYLTIEIRGADPDRGPRVVRPARLWLRYLPGGVPVERAARGAGPGGQSLAAARRRSTAGRSPSCGGRRIAELRASLKNSAMARAGLLRLRRNLAVCAGATGDADALSALREVDEPTCDDPIVAEHIHWALELHD